MTKTPIGGIYAFSFSGFILCTKEDFPSLELMRGGVTFKVNALTRIAPATWRPIPQFVEDTFQQTFPGAPKGLPLRMAALPSLDADGKPTMQVLFGDDGPDWSDLPRDTIIITAIWGEGNNKIHAEKIFGELLAWIRVLTRQWWVGRSSEPLTGNLHVECELETPTAVLGFPMPTGRQTTPGEDSKRLSITIWQEAGEKLKHGIKPAWHEMMFLSLPTT